VILTIFAIVDRLRKRDTHFHKSRKGIHNIIEFKVIIKKDRETIQLLEH